MQTFLVKGAVCFKTSGWDEAPLPYWEYRLVEARDAQEAEDKFVDKVEPEIVREYLYLGRDYKVIVKPIIVLETVR